MTQCHGNADDAWRNILDVGYEFFTTQPYSVISVPLICRRAGVTRGALQHHFGGKFGLFKTVFDELQRNVVDQMVLAVHSHDDPWTKVSACIAAFLEACTAPEYQAVVVREGPPVIGWRRWRELDIDCVTRVADVFVHAMAGDGYAEHPSRLLAALVRAVLTELSFTIAASDDHQGTLTEALAVLDLLGDSFRRGRAQHPSDPAVEPSPTLRIGLGQLRASAGSYLDRVATGNRIAIVRRGTVVAELGPPTESAIAAMPQRFRR